jgi:predicted Zn finger-like uncharacterized protein
MKVSCQSCGAKYTIADDKVRGRKVKIRCKSCGSPIVVDGQSDAPPPDPSATAPEPFPAAAPAGDSWTVNLSDTDQRSMTTQEIVDGWKTGLVTTDAFVWKDGMADWMPVLDHPDLKPLLASAAPAVASAGLPASSGGPARLAGTGRLASAGAVDLFGGVDVAGSEEEEDISTSAPAVPQAGTQPYDDGKLTGARNENSVLFSLDSLKSGLGPNTKPVPARKPPPSPLDLGGPADLMGGAHAAPIFSLGADQALLTAPAPPEPPPPKVPSGVPGAPGGLNKMWLIGGGVAMVLLAAVAFAVGKSGTSSAEKELAAAAEASAAAVARAQEAEEAARKAREDADRRAEEAKKAAEEAKKAEEARAAAASSAAAAPAATETAKAQQTPAPGGGASPPKSGGGGGSPPPKKEEPVVQATGPFSVSAAQVALTTAATNAQSCKKPGGPTGSGKAQVTFANSGRVTSATVSGAGFAGTPVGGCVASTFRRAHVPPFTGNPVTVAKSFSIH